MVVEGQTTFGLPDSRASLSTDVPQPLENTTNIRVTQEDQGKLLGALQRAQENISLMISRVQRGEASDPTVYRSIFSDARKEAFSVGTTVVLESMRYGQLLAEAKKSSREDSAQK